MGNMKQQLGNTTSTTFLHQPRYLWKSPRGTVLRIEALALVAIFITFFLAVLGSCRRWSNHWIVQKGFLVANVLSLSLGTYSIGIMQSSSVKSEMYPLWTVSLFTLMGCTDSVTSYNGLDYKSPLLKMLFQLSLYCGYVLLMSISTISTDIGNIAIGLLSIITFIKGFHRSLALVLQSRMRDMVAKTVDLQEPRFLSRGRDYGEERENMIVDFPPDLENLVYGSERPALSNTVHMADIDLVCQEKDKLRLCSDVCVAFSLSHQLQRHILGLSEHVDNKVDLCEDIIDYKWAFKVIGVELAFLYEVFFTGNAFLHFYEAKAASILALASFIGICFVGVAVAIPGTMTSRTKSLGSGTTVVDTTPADLSITLFILVSLALLQLMQLIWCWTSNWARLAFVCECARNQKKGIGIKWSWWMKLKWFAISRTNWFDKYLWQDKLGQCSLAGKGGSWKFLSSSITSMGGPRMHGLQYIGHALWDLLGSDINKGAAFRLDDDVKTSITDFLCQVRSDMIDGHWLSELHENGVDIDELPYMIVQDKNSFVNVMFQNSASFGFIYAHSVMVWHVATCYCELAEQEKQDALLNQNKEDSIAAIAGCFRKAVAAAGGGAGGGERERNRHVSNALSKYCTYLVVSAPELLPGPSAHAKRAYDVFAEEAKMAPREAMTGNYSFLIGMDLGMQLLGERPPRDGVSLCSDPWKALALVWIQMLVYAAPYGNVDAHMRHLAQGGEFITHLWALLYHLGIRKWQPPKVEKDTPAKSLEEEEEGSEVEPRIEEENSSQP
uniref:DUF4220 domain-containing protein n=1 Tax=Leersia perrieri TaxID=77586 RepID=A0A0D9X5Y1_9ORYZ